MKLRQDVEHLEKGEPSPPPSEKEAERNTFSLAKITIYLVIVGYSLIIQVGRCIKKDPNLTGSCPLQVAFILGISGTILVMKASLNATISDITWFPNSVSLVLVGCLHS